MSELVFYRINKGVPIFLRKGVRDRPWMDETTNQYAYRCLPLTIANQNGYEIATSEPIKVIWNGGNAIEDIYIETSPAGRGIVTSHFGFGVLTFHTNLMPRTPKNVNVRAGGPPNNPKRGITPLEGIIESDWNPSTFTMNWKMTEPFHEVVFDAYEPFCFVQPMPRGYVEDFTAVIRPIENRKDEYERYTQWSESREKFNEKLDKNDWQKHYFQGVYNDQSRCPIDHQTKIKLEDPKIDED